MVTGQWRETTVVTGGQRRVWREKAVVTRQWRETTVVTRGWRRVWREKAVVRRRAWREKRAVRKPRVKWMRRKTWR